MWLPLKILYVSANKSKGKVVPFHVSKVYRGRRGTAPLISTIYRWVGKFMPWLLDPPRKCPGNHWIWAPEPLRMFCRQEKSLGPTKIQTPDYPVSSTVTAPHTVLYLLQSYGRVQNWSHDNNGVNIISESVNWTKLENTKYWWWWW
jgi:hypothetical protein